LIFGPVVELIADFLCELLTMIVSGFVGGLSPE
jgi:hypothetical protein